MVDRIASSDNISPLFNQEQSINNQQNLLEQINQIETMNQLQTVRPTQDEGQESAIGDLADFASDFRSAFGELQAAAEDLMIPAEDNLLGDDSVFAARTAEVSDPEIAEVRAETGAERGEITLEITELATRQEEISEGFAVEESDFSSGEVQFEIEQDGNVETFELEVDGDASNLEVLEQVAEEIEVSDLQLSAEVNIEDDQVSLEVFTTDVGSDQAFEIEDLAGDLVTELNLETSQEASDAQVEVEDLAPEEVEVSGNQVLLDDGRVALDALATGSVNIEVDSDIETIQAGIEDFVDSFNQALEFINEQEDNGAMDQLRDGFLNLARFESSNLQAIGIETDEEGFLEINEERLEADLEERISVVENNLGGGVGFAAQTELRADNALRTAPSQFMEVSNEPDQVDQMIELDNLITYDETARQTGPYIFAQQGFMIDFFL